MAASQDEEEAGDAEEDELQPERAARAAVAALDAPPELDGARARAPHWLDAAA